MTYCYDIPDYVTVALDLPRSVRPKRLGGVAGGKKYVWRGILFKLADGSQGPYGGSDEAAAKAAGHELRSASKKKAAPQLQPRAYFF